MRSLKYTVAIFLLIIVQSCSSRRTTLTVGQQNPGEKISHRITAKVDADVNLSPLLPGKADSARGVITYFIQPDGRVLGSNLGMYVLYSGNMEAKRLTDPAIKVSDKSDYTDVQMKIFNALSEAVRLNVDQATQSIEAGIYMYRLPITVRLNSP